MGLRLLLEMKGEQSRKENYAGWISPCFEKFDVMKRQNAFPAWNLRSFKVYFRVSLHVIDVPKLENLPSCLAFCNIRSLKIANAPKLAAWISERTNLDWL